jgi:hypothetical protein
MYPPPHTHRRARKSHTYTPWLAGSAAPPPWSFACQVLRRRIHVSYEEDNTYTLWSFACQVFFFEKKEKREREERERELISLSDFIFSERERENESSYPLSYIYSIQANVCVSISQVTSQCICISLVNCCAGLVTRVSISQVNAFAFQADVCVLISVIYIYI